MSEEEIEKDGEAAATEAAQTTQIPQSVINLHNKALSALERGNIDIAIDILFRCVEQCPAFVKARENLRRTEIARFLGKNGASQMPHKIFEISSIFAMSKIGSLVKSGKCAEAMVECEKLFIKDPLSLPLAKIFAEAAIKAGHPEAGFWTLETIREHLPNKSLAILETLGKLYHANKNYRKARECLEKVHRARPQDAAISKLLKDSEALSTLDSGWTDAEKSGDYRRGLKDAEEATKLEQANKSVKTEDDAETIIRETLAKIAAEPKNVNYYLSLSTLYGQQKNYDEALSTIARAREIVGNDGELDRRNSALTIAKFDADIAELAEAGKEAEAAAKQTERDQFVFNDIAERVHRYPNDQQLRYELALQYFKYDYTDEAVEQFQIAQKSPTVRVSSLYHLSLCFRKKGLLDMAVSQLEQALEFLPSMNAQKMEIYYLMGEISLEENKLDDAAKFFKEVYKVDVKFRDIAKYIEQVYAEQKKAKAT